MKVGTLGLTLILALLLAALLYSMTNAADVHSTSLSLSSSLSAVSAHAVSGPPTVTAAFMNQVLRSAHSPAQGLGTALYRLGVQHHIDPAYALAVFHHESTYGLAGVARLTQSLGNIRCSAGYTCLSGYRDYPSWAAGAADWYALIAQVYLAHELVTVEQIIPVYAPASDKNNVQAYISSVLADVEHWRKGQVSG